MRNKLIEVTKIKQATQNGWDDLENYMGSIKYRNHSRPIIAITNNHSIVCSVGFVKCSWIKESNSKYVLLAFSKSKKAITFTFLKENWNNIAVPLKPQDDMRIYAKEFFRINDIIDPCYMGKYEAELENIPGRGDSWVIYLDKKL